jgi:hypothetical protein
MAESASPAARSCARSLLVRATTSTDDFWAQNQAVLVSVDGNKYPMTYSFDSEVELGDQLQWSDRIPEMQPLLEKSYGDEVMTLGELLDTYMTNLSERQIRTFVLRKSVPTDRKTFAYRDFNPSYLGKLFPTQAMVWNLADFWKRYMPEHGLPFTAHVDGEMVEFTHTSYSTAPNEFKNVMAKFDSMFKHSNTHFHVGIPDVIGKDNALAIARAVETRLVLAMARRWPKYTQAAAYNEGTTLGSSEELASERGFIRYEFSEWKQPHSSANLEIRQWPSRHEAFTLMALASEMALNYRKIYLPALDTWFTFRPDARIGNVAGALAYASAVFARSSNPEDRALAAPLASLAQRTWRDLDRNKKVKPVASTAIQEEVAEFLTRHRIDTRLTHEMFLK